jgi:small subunit ribosomal protein S10
MNKICMALYLKAFDFKILDQTVNKIINTSSKFGILISGPIRLPTKIKKFTVLRSPHIDKKSREQFEIRTHKRLLNIFNTKENTINTFLKYVEDNLPSGVNLKITLFSFKKRIKN